MTVSNTNNKISYSTDGTTKVFPYTFKIFEDDEISIILRSATGTETTVSTGFTVSGAGDDSGGNITFTTAPADNQTLVIVRTVDLTQETDYVENSEFAADSHENALDKLTMINQQQTEELNRSLKIPVSDDSSLSVELPSSSSRASKFLGFDSNGNPVASQGSVGGVTVSDFMKTVVDDTDASTARTTLGIPTYITNLLPTYSTVWIDAGAIVPSTTSGCASLATNEYTTNLADMDYLAFDGSGNEYAEFKFSFPPTWDGGTIKAKFYWSTDPTASGSGTVTFGLRGRAVSNNDTIDSSWGSRKSVTDTLISSDGSKLQISPTTSGITIAGTPESEDMILFEVMRDATVSGASSGDAWLFGVNIQYKNSYTTIEEWS